MNSLRPSARRRASGSLRSTWSRKSALSTPGTGGRACAVERNKDHDPIPFQACDVLFVVGKKLWSRVSLDMRGVLTGRGLPSSAWAGSAVGAARSRRRKERTRMPFRRAATRLPRNPSCLPSQGPGLASPGRQQDQPAPPASASTTRPFGDSATPQPWPSQPRAERRSREVGGRFLCAPSPISLITTNRPSAERSARVDWSSQEKLRLLRLAGAPSRSAPDDRVMREKHSAVRRRCRRARARRERSARIEPFPRDRPPRASRPGPRRATR